MSGMITGLRKEAKLKGTGTVWSIPNTIYLESDGLFFQNLLREESPALAFLTGAQYAALCVKQRKDRRFKHTYTKIRESVLVIPPKRLLGRWDVMLCRDFLADAVNMFGVEKGFGLEWRDLPVQVAERYSAFSASEQEKPLALRRSYRSSLDRNLSHPGIDDGVPGDVLSWLFGKHHQTFKDTVESGPGISGTIGKFSLYLYPLPPADWGCDKVHAPEVRNLYVNPYGAITAYPDSRFNRMEFKQYVTLLKDESVQERERGRLCLAGGSGGELSVAEDPAYGAVSLAEDD